MTIKKYCQIEFNTSDEMHKTAEVLLLAYNDLYEKKQLENARGWTGKIFRKMTGESETEFEATEYLKARADFVSAFNEQNPRYDINTILGYTPEETEKEQRIAKDTMEPEIQEFFQKIAAKIGVRHIPPYFQKGMSL